MWLKKLKKKKLQCFLIGTLLFLSSLIFTSSLCMVTSIKGYVNDVYSKDEIYDLSIFNSNEGAKNDVVEWCNGNSNVNDIQVKEAFVSGNDIYYNDKNLKIPMYEVSPIDNSNELPFKINKVESLDNESKPKEGEIWITQIVADNQKIKLGDDLTFKIKDKDVTLKVSSLINDSNEPSSTVGQIIFYINNNNIEDFSSFTKSPIIFIDVKSGVDASDLGQKLTSDVKTGGLLADKDLLIQASVMAPIAVGGICTLASVFIFIVSIILIRFILWNNILKEYKSIGIYKALGFTKKQILNFYIIGYSLTAFIGSILGALCSIPILNYTASKSLRYIGEFNGVDINLPAIFGTILLFSIIVIINLYFVVRKTNKISPVEALRTGVTSSKKKLTKSLIKNTTSSFALAVNDIFKYKKISILITLTLTLSFTLVLLFGNTNVMVGEMNKNTNVWFGLPKSSITVSTKMTLDAPLTASQSELENVLNKVKSDDRVKNYVNGCLLYNGVSVDKEKYNIKSTVLSTTVMDSFDNDFKFTIIHGHNPEKYNEVSVTTNILKDSGLTVGDYIELSINNNKKSYLISGSYNSLMSNGYTMRMLNSAVQKEYPEFEGSEIFLNLKDGADTDKFTKDIADEYSNLDASDIHPLLKFSIESMPELLLPITQILMAVFMIFSAITILNIIVMNVRDNRRNFGIMKALGFTSKEIRNRYLYRILILTTISTIIAVILNLTISRPLIAAAVSGLDVLIISPKMMAVLLVVMITLILFITIASCRNIKNTKPTELMEE